MKRLLAAAAALLLCAPIFSRSIRKSPKAESAFNDINMVELKASQPQAKYDVYTIGENTQSYTAERFVLPFRMNAYEIGKARRSSHRPWRLPAGDHDQLVRRGGLVQRL